MPDNNDPYLFISHKHDDAKIASVVARFVEDISGGRVKVFQSSNSDFEGPRIGMNLNEELNKALSRSEVVLLIYTSNDKSWDYCMWECGKAEDPVCSDTNVMVMQCLEDVPTVFEGQIRARADNLDSLKKFAKRFMDEDLFPKYGRSVTGFSEQRLEELAAEYFEKLSDVIPKEPPNNWSAWPQFRFAVTGEALEEFKEAMSENSEDRIDQLLREKALVKSYNNGFPGLFGRANLSKDLPVGELVDSWKESYTDREIGWWNIIVKQVMDGADEKEPKIETWEHFREVNGDNEYVPGLTAIGSNSAMVQFDFNFFLLGPVPTAGNRMTKVKRMFSYDMNKKGTSDKPLIEILSELENNNWRRAPILDGNKPRCVVHLKSIDRFLRLKHLEGKKIEDLKLTDILDDESFSKLFKNTFVTLGPNATLADVSKKMYAVRHCKDIFITENGGPEEKVLGWITDNDIADESVKFL